MALELHGVIPAVITPFDEMGQIDEKTLRAELDFHLSCGVTAVCAGGSTGEGAGLSREDVARLNGIFVDQVRGRVPVIAGIIPDTTEEAVDLGLAARQAGAVALQVTPPHYLFQPGIPELVSYYSEIRARTGLELIVYNVLPWGQVTAQGVEKLLEADAIGAVKQSGSNMHQLADMVYHFGKKIPILSALDDLLYPSFVLGAHGTLSAIASVLPRECVQLFEAVQRGDHQRAQVMPENNGESRRGSGRSPAISFYLVRWVSLLSVAVVALAWKYWWWVGAITLLLIVAGYLLWFWPSDSRK